MRCARGVVLLSALSLYMAVAHAASTGNLTASTTSAAAAEEALDSAWGDDEDAAYLHGDDIPTDVTPYPLESRPIYADEGGKLEDVLPEEEMSEAGGGDPLAEASLEPGEGLPWGAPGQRDGPSHRSRRRG